MLERRRFFRGIRGGWLLEVGEGGGVMVLWGCRCGAIPYLTADELLYACIIYDILS